MDDLEWRTVGGGYTRTDLIAALRCAERHAEIYDSGQRQRIIKAIRHSSMEADYMKGRTCHSMDGEQSGS